MDVSVLGESRFLSESSSRGRVHGARKGPRGAASEMCVVRCAFALVHVMFPSLVVLVDCADSLGYCGIQAGTGCVVFGLSSRCCLRRVSWCRRLWIIPCLGGVLVFFRKLLCGASGESLLCCIPSAACGASTCVGCVVWLRVRRQQSG